MDASTVREKYVSLGLGESFDEIEKSGRTSAASFLRMLEKIPLRPALRYAYSPTSFDAYDRELRAMPRVLEESWTTGSAIMRHYGSSAVMMRTPIFWQFGLPIYRACRDLGIPIFVNEPENIPVGAMSLVRGGIDTVITENIDAAPFSSYLLEKSLPRPKLWVLIHRASASDWTSPGGVATDTSALAQEVHLFPGVTMLTQCPTLADQKTPRFHAAEGCDIEIGTTSFASFPALPIPLHRYELPGGLRTTGTCACGKDIIEKI